MPRQAVSPGRLELAETVEGMDPDAFEAFLTYAPEQERAWLRDIAAERFGHGWRADPASFAHHLDPQYLLWPYIVYLSQKFLDVVEGRCRRLAVAVPPRYGKSYLFSRWGPAWLFDRRPEANIILASYGDTLANENAVTVRDILAEHTDVLRCTLRRDRKRLDRFVTEQGGGLLSAGMNSAITGFGAGNGGGVIIDDPFKGWQDAHSPHQRELIWNQYRSVLHSRLDDPEAFVIVVHTRWHTDDLTGRLVDAAQNETGDEFEVIVLPELAEQNDPLGREPGDPLEPEKFDLQQILEKHRAAGAYLTSALYQGHPSPEEGTELLRQWWKLGEPPARFDEWCTSWDMKLKEKESGDYVVGQVWGRVGSDYWIVDQVRGQWDQATTRVGMALLCVRWPNVERHLVENAGYGPEVMQQIRQPNPTWRCDDEMAGRLGILESERPDVERIIHRGIGGMVAVNAKGSKVVRARAVAPLLEAGNMHLAQSGPWVPGFIDEASQFPDGEHDDQVDAWSQGLARLSGRGGPATVQSQTRRQLPPKIA